MNPSKILNIKKEQVIELETIIHEFKTNKKEKVRLSSGSKYIDNMLGGGFHAGKMYLIFGANKTGKTQFTHQICVQSYNEGKKQKKREKTPIVYYFDTENTFRAERIRELASTRDLGLKDILKNIMVSQIMSNSALLLALNNLEGRIKNNIGNVLIIDSINNYYRYEQGDKTISFYQAKNTFMSILNKINELTEKFGLIAIATAQIAPNFIEDAIIKEKPVGNQFLNHFFTEYLYLSSKDKDTNYIHLVNSSFLPEKKIAYKITSAGIEDHSI